MLHPAVFRGFSCCPCSLRHRAVPNRPNAPLSAALTTTERPAYACRKHPDNNIAPGGRVATAPLPPTLMLCLEEPGPPGDWFSRHVPLPGILRRRRPPGEPFSCKGFRSIPAPRTSSIPPRTTNVTPVTNFVTPRPGHGPSSPGCATQGSVHNRYPIASKEPLARGAHGAPYVQTTGYAYS